MQTIATKAPPQQPGQPYRFTTDEYFRMAESGVLDPNVRTELVDGQVIVMSPKNFPHTQTKAAIHETLQETLRDQRAWQVLNQDSIPIPDRNAPEPDIAVVPRLRRRLPVASEALLLIEVSDTTLADDLERKRLLYAGAQVPNYWVADVNTRVVHRFAEPRDGDYTVHEVLGVADSIRVPGAQSDAAVVPVSAFFPD